MSYMNDYERNPCLAYINVIQEIESDIYDRIQITEDDGGSGQLKDHPHPPSNHPFSLSSSVNPLLHTADGCSQ